MASFPSTYLQYPSMIWQIYVPTFFLTFMSKNYTWRILFQLCCKTFYVYMSGGNVLVSYVTCKLRTIEKPKQIFKNCLQCMQYEVKGLGMLMANLPGIFLVSPLPKVCPFLFWSEIQNGCTSEQSVKTLNKYFSKKLDTLLNLICTWMVIE